jgi:hypothetical protein
MVQFSATYTNMLWKILDYRMSLTARPTAPRPKIATVEPFFGFATFRVAPSPEK